MIDNIPGTKDEIYTNVKSYFARAYVDANSVIQTDDKEQGIIIGKGLYPKVYVLKLLGVVNTYLDCYHILRVDVKEGKVRIICSANMWEEYNGKGELDDRVYIVDYASFTDKRLFDKGRQMEATVNLIDEMLKSIANLEKTLKVGGLSIETEEW